MQTLTLIQKIAVWIIPVLLAITMHEAAHAWAASRLGDSTAKMLGRLSINPMRHIDLVGTILVPILVGVLSQFNFVFGWAKPVPINGAQLHHPRRDMALVTAAGPAANLIMALMWAGLFKLVLILNTQSSITLFLLLMAQAGIVINLILALLNLLPIPPLDGSRIAASLLPPRYAYHYMKIEPYGFFILIGLMFTGFLGWILSPALNASIRSLKYLFNI